MKIGNKELKEYYDAFIESTILDEKIKCPKKSEMWTFIYKKKSEKLKTKFVDHITKCKSCRRYFELITNVRRDQIAFNSEVEKFFNSIQFVNRQKRKLNHLVASPQIIMKAALSVFGIVFFAISIILLIKDDTISSTRFKSSHEKDNLQIILVKPIGENIKKSALAFQWSKNNIFDKYYLELYDERLSLVWKSCLLPVTTLIIPSDIVENLFSQQAYYWMVYGIEKSGKIHESTLGRFIFE
jgi:hypothetical protein